MKNFLLLFLLLASISTFSQEQLSLLDTVKLEEVIVKSVRADKKAPFAQTTVQKKEIEQRNLGQDIPILLNYLPSVVTTTDAGAGIGYTGIRVRGSDATRVNVTINGIAYNDSESQGTFWVNLPDFASSVENLQLQRGVGTSTNGSGAFGASLNILTDAIADEAFGEVSASVGSYNTFKTNVKFSTGLLKDRLELSGRLSILKSDGYIDRATSDLKSYYLQAAYKNENTLLKAVTFGGHEITYQAWYGIDKETLETDRTFNPAGIYSDDSGNIKFYDNEVDNYKQDHYQLHWGQKYNSNWSSNVALNYTHGEGYFEQYKEDEDFEDYGFEPIEIGGEVIDQTDLIRRRWLDNDYYVLNASANYINSNIDFIFGGSFSQYNGDHFGEVIWAQYASNSEIRDRYYFGDGNKRDMSIFAKATYKINNNWSVFGDLQERFVNYKTSGLTSDQVAMNIDENYAFFNPKFGTTYRINNYHDVYTSYARANREPNRNDFENGISEAETLNDIELGWRFNKKAIAINTNVYYMFYANQLVLTGKIDDVGNPIRTTSGSSYRLGIEVDANFEISKQWSIRPNFTLSSNKNKDFVASIDGEVVDLGETNISYSPNVIMGNVLSYIPNSKLQFHLLSKFVGEQYMGNIDSEASKLDSYFVNDLNISYVFKDVSVFDAIEFSALVNNIFNVKYVSNGYFYTYDDTWSNPGETITIEGAGYYPQAEINFLLGVNFKF